MTSNVGASLITNRNGGSLGFSAGDDTADVTDEKIRETVLDELKKEFKPEFLNRVDDIIVFHQLSKEDIREIAKRLLDKLAARVKEMDIDIDCTDAVIDKIADIGFDPVYGARPLKRAIQSEIEDRLSEKMLDGSVKAGNKYTFDVIDDKIAIKQ